MRSAYPRSTLATHTLAFIWSLYLSSYTLSCPFSHYFPSSYSFSFPNFPLFLQCSSPAVAKPVELENFPGCSLGRKLTGSARSLRPLPPLLSFPLLSIPLIFPSHFLCISPLPFLSYQNVRLPFFENRASQWFRIVHFIEQNFFKLVYCFSKIWNQHHNMYGIV